MAYVCKLVGQVGPLCVGHCLGRVPGRVVDVHGSLATVQYSTRYLTIPCNTLQYLAISCNAVRYTWVTCLRGRQCTATACARPLYLPLLESVLGLFHSSAMALPSSSDVAVLALGVALAAAYLFRDQLFASAKPKAVAVAPQKTSNGSGNPRDFILKMKEGVRLSSTRSALLLTSP